MPLMQCSVYSVMSRDVCYLIGSQSLYRQQVPSTHHTSRAGHGTLDWMDMAEYVHTHHHLHQSTNRDRPLPSLIIAESDASLQTDRSRSASRWISYGSASVPRSVQTLVSVILCFGILVEQTDRQTQARAYNALCIAQCGKNHTHFSELKSASFHSGQMTTCFLL